MRKKFKLINKFLSGYGLNKIDFSWNWYSYDSDIPEWNWYGTSLKHDRKTNIPENILTILVEVLENYWEETLTNVISESETYRIELEIYPKESKWIIKGMYEDDVNQDESYQRESTNKDLNEFMDSRDIEFVKAEYDGGGDSGYISSVEINGKDLGNIYHIQQNQDYRIITDELYSVLEIYVSGWEIDDGSAGKVEIIKPKGNNAQISIEHTWFSREFFYSKKDVILTNETFSDGE
jgi:hypothetical protein